MADIRIHSAVVERTPPTPRIRIHSVGVSRDAPIATPLIRIHAAWVTRGFEPPVTVGTTRVRYNGAWVDATIRVRYGGVWV